jgi:hypothetical protein
MPSLGRGARRLIPATQTMMTMNQPPNEFDQDRHRKVRYRLLGFSNAALLIAATNFVIWLVFLFPIYAATDGISNSGGMSFLLVFFIGTDVVGLGLAAIAMFKSRLRKTMANYGFVVNVAMIGLNLSILPY